MSYPIIPLINKYDTPDLMKIVEIVMVVQKKIFPSTNNFSFHDIWYLLVNVPFRWFRFGYCDHAYKPIGMELESLFIL